MEGTWYEANEETQSRVCLLTCMVRVTDLHGEGGASLFEEDVPHVECTLHACRVEHTWTSGAPAAISQVSCTVPGSV